jgi:hypothetical protein
MTKVPEATVWPVLAVTFLLGIGLVSLLDILTGNDGEAPALEMPETSSGVTTVWVAPGAEHLLSGLDAPERVRLHMPWQPLPALAQNYLLVLRDSTDHPRLPDGWIASNEVSREHWRFVEIETVEERPESDRFDLMARLDWAEVYFEAEDGSVLPCSQWRFGRWTCGLEEWLWVGQTQVVIRGQERQCIWAHPKVQYDLVIRFPQLEIGRRLSGRYGMSDEAAESPEGGDVDFTVRVGDQIRELSAQNRRGFYSYQVVTEDLDGQRAEVEFRVSAGYDGRRHFCFTASILGVGEESALEAPDPAEAPIHPLIPAPQGLWQLDSNIRRSP